MCLSFVAEDHRNDILSNTCAVITAAVATWHRQAFALDNLRTQLVLVIAHCRSNPDACLSTCSNLWWVDPVGAVLLSAYIIWCWTEIGTEQINLMVRLRVAVDIDH